MDRNFRLITSFAPENLEQLLPSLCIHTMSGKLNAGAFEFVPGRGFVAPTPPFTPPPAPLERPEQTEAPTPPPTISLNIGGSKPLPAPKPVSAPAPARVPVYPPAATVKAANQTPPSAVPSSTASPAPSKTFSTEKAKNDTLAIAREVQAVADASVLQDLYGDSECDHNLFYKNAFVTPLSPSQRTS